MMNYQEDFVQVQLREIADTATGESAYETVRYDQFVGWLLKPDTKTMTELHIAIGLAGEVAELVEAYYGFGDGATPTNMEEELGDIEFYLEAWRSKFGMDQGNLVDTSWHVFGGKECLARLVIISGQFLDAVKRVHIYGKPSAEQNFQDIYNKFCEGLNGFYRHFRDFTRPAILQQNATKLQRRYVKLAYSAEAALGRADKAKD